MDTVRKNVAGNRDDRGMDAWVEKVDGALETKACEIQELCERLLRLERRSSLGSYSA